MRIIKILSGLLFIGILFLYFNFFSTFVMPWQRDDAINAALTWGQLNKLPENAEIIYMEKPGSMFTRQFIIEFTSSEPAIKNWILKSKGFKNVKPEIRNGIKTYEIHPRDSEAYGGKVKIEGTRVLINMSWS
ncbi:hypothetical protein [Flavobacterium daemonense]|uniref:hypothetical protein n=1 Tax=Flavobacterium daemonense TaxID=1393049 RepID=UPI0011855D79|nr:hypothetical protein [Flavobacterium daemonense]KAF2331302.1 hypothetical protein FND99_13725 [Flavobacterium daemonense]